MRFIYITLLLFTLSLAQAEMLSPEKLPLSAQQIATLKEIQLDEMDDGQLTWKGNPLSIALPLGKEKRVIFPEPIALDINGALTTDQLRIINNDQNLYLTAQKPFSKTRVYVTLKNSHQIILLDLSTTDTSTSTTQKITLTDKKTHSSVMEEKIMSADAYVDAVRFAWQQFYAPQRLLSAGSNFTRTPMFSQFWTPELVYGDKVLVHPQASWQREGLYITAVELRNKYPHSTSLKLSHDICGEWQAAVLYPRQKLKPAGEKSGDATTLFLISSKPFSQSMEICHGGS